MNNKQAQAQELVKAFLSESIKLELCENPIQSMQYYITDSDDLVFRFSLFKTLSVGSSQYVVVSKKTGQVRYIGEHGE